MCNVCGASRVLGQPGKSAIFAWEGCETGWLEVQTRGFAGPKGQPGEYRLRIGLTAEWTDWLPSNDLAGTLGLLGTDVKWRSVPDPVRAWVKFGPRQPVLDMLAAHAQRQ